MKEPDTFESTRKLIALKRYETPGEAYFESFLDEFKERQRSELLRTPTHRLVWEQIDLWLDQWRGKTWLSAGLGAAAAVAICLAVLKPGSNQESPAGASGVGGVQLAAVETPAPSSLIREF